MNIQNPFVIAGRVPDLYFCDRVEETEHLIRLLQGGANVLLSAPRRIGKSKLIDHCFQQPALADHYHTIYVDLFHTTGLQSLTRALGSAVFDEVLTWDEKLRMQVMAVVRTVRPQLSYDGLSGKPSWSVDWTQMREPSLTLKEIFTILEQSDRPCLVALDEFQQVAEYSEEGTEALLRGYIQRMSNCHFIFSGSKRHLLAQMFTQQNRPFFSSAEPMALQPIPVEKYQAFAEYWMEQFRKTIAPDVVANMYALGEGNTAFLQRAMHYAFDLLGAGEQLTEEVMQQAIQNLLTASDEFYQELLATLNERQQQLLRAIAMEHRATSILGGAFIQRYGLSSASAVQAALKKLMEGNFVIEDKGAYCLSDIILQLWLTRK